MHRIMGCAICVSYLHRKLKSIQHFLFSIEKKKRLSCGVPQKVEVSCSPCELTKIDIKKSSGSYYPFGLKHNGPWLARKNQGFSNKYNYNGKEEMPFTGYLYYGFRVYDPAMARFTSVDPISDQFPHVSTFNYAENEPIAHIDLHGLQQVRYGIKQKREETGPVRFGGTRVGEPDGRIIEAAGELVLDEIPFAGEAMSIAQGDYTGAALGAIPLIGGAIKMIRRWIKSSRTVIDNVGDVSGATKNRVKLRKNTKETIKENAPKTDDGTFIDPNTLEPIEGPYDIGHKTGQEWRTRKKMHQKKGSTRKEVIETENDPNLYQIEDRSNNRSHKYEKKDKK